MCYSQLHPSKDLLLDEAFPIIVDTWNNRKPVMHISEQRQNSRLGAHSDYISTLPDKFLDLILETGKSIDLEVEAKMKEQAIFKLYELYPSIFM